MKQKVVTRTVTEKEIDHSATGMLFRAMRTEAKVSLRAIAKAMGKSAPYIGDLELGRRNWTLELFASAKSALSKIK